MHGQIKGKSFLPDISCDWCGDTGTAVFGQDTNAAPNAAPNAVALLSDIAYPQWCLNRFEAEANYGTDAAIVEQITLADVASPENAKKATAILDNMAGFLSRQPACTFILDYELNSQTTMGVIETRRNGGKYCDSFDFQLARPNLLRISDRKKRDEKIFNE